MFVVVDSQCAVRTDNAVRTKLDKAASLTRSEAGSITMLLEVTADVRLLGREFRGTSSIVFHGPSVASTSRFLQPLYSLLLSLLNRLKHLNTKHPCKFHRNLPNCSRNQGVP